MSLNPVALLGTVVVSLAFFTNVIACSSSDSEQAAPEDAFVVTKKTIEFDPRWCSDQSGTLWFGLGSASVELQGVEDDRCVFTYMHEVEGGYSLYRCSVAQSEARVTIEATGLIEVRTSFDIEQCELQRSGNLLIDKHEEHQTGGEDA